MHRLTSIILSLVLLVATAGVVAAGESEVEYIDNLYLTGLEASIAGDRVTLYENLAELNDIVGDEEVSPACRKHADVALTTMVLASQADLFSNALYLPALSKAGIDQYPFSRNDCLLAI